MRPEGELAGHLSDLAAQLRGPRIREAILTELRDGLDHATEDHIAAGLPPDQAQGRDHTQFGTPHAVADAFGGELPPPIRAAPSSGSSPPDPSWESAAAPASSKPLAHRTDRALGAIPVIR